MKLLSFPRAYMPIYDILSATLCLHPNKVPRLLTLPHSSAHRCMVSLQELHSFPERIGLGFWNFSVPPTLFCPYMTWQLKLPVLLRPDSSWFLIFFSFPTLLVSLGEVTFHGLTHWLTHSLKQSRTLSRYFGGIYAVALNKWSGIHLNVLNWHRDHRITAPTLQFVSRGDWRSSLLSSLSERTFYPAKLAGFSVRMLAYLGTLITSLWGNASGYYVSYNHADV